MQNIMTRTIEVNKGNELQIIVDYDNLTKYGEITLNVPDFFDTGVMATHKIPFHLPEN